MFPSELGQALKVLDGGWRHGRWGTLESEANQIIVTMAFQVVNIADALLCFQLLDFAQFQVLMVSWFSCV